MLILQDIAYTHPDKDLLFSGINLTINRQDKIALIGNNGSGKSTLLKIMAGILAPAAGNAKADQPIYYVPQVYGQFNDFNIAEALGIADKLQALKEILDGHVTAANMAQLDDDWGIDERCRAAFSHWGLDDVALDQKMVALSGGQKTKLFLAGMAIHQPGIVLLDEPSNHLDVEGRRILYNYIITTANTLVVVSHDRTLLNLLGSVAELDKRGITIYGGNYDFYTVQKSIENDALNHDLKTKEKELRKAKETERESLERQQKLDARGKKKQVKAGVPTIALNTLRNNAERSTSRMKDIHEEKVGAIAQELGHLRKVMPATDKIKMDFDNSALHKGKILITAKGVNFGYGDQLLWNQALNFEIRSGERIAVKGRNGSGKTTVIKMILGELTPSSGTIELVEVRTIYIDQDYSLIDDTLTVYEQAQQFNSGLLEEHEIKIRLTRFLFTKTYWNKPCKALSGGEKMRLMLCCLTIGSKAPDIIVLDEPTNNLDIQNLEILTAAVNEYKGTLIVISHDEYFLNQVNVNRTIVME